MAGPSGIASYSTTPATNATFDGGSGNWAENQLPSTVNNTARQQVADTRAAFNDLIWFSYGSGDQASGGTFLGTPYTYASSTSVAVAGVDVTAVHHAGRRMKFVGSSTGTIYGSITSSSFSTNTTINFAWDSGSLSNETLTGYLSQTPVTGEPVAVGSIGGQGILDISNGAAGQIKFPATQNASSNVNTLDDYEEGTWTPTFGLISVDPTGTTYATQYGSYTKIGNRVFIEFAVTLTATGTGGTGNICIKGLPFPTTNANAAYRTRFIVGFSNVTLDTGYTFVSGESANNVSLIGFSQTGSGLASMNMATLANFANNSIIRGSGFYVTA